MNDLHASSDIRFSHDAPSAYGQQYFETVVAECQYAPDRLPNFFATRTRFLDDVVMDAVSARGITQVVIAGCGGDARAYRLPLPPHVHVFELDFPAVMAYRAGVLGDAAARCHVHAVPCDLSQPQWPAHVLAAGLQPALKSLWLVEGVLPYLLEAQINALLDAVAALSGPGSMLAGDVQNSAYQRHPSTAAFRSVWARLGAGFVSATDDPAARLAPRGYTCHVVPQQEYAARLGRGPAHPIQTDADAPRSLFFTATRDVV